MSHEFLVRPKNEASMALGSVAVERPAHGFRAKLARVAAVGLLLTAAEAAVTTEELLHPTAAYADTLGYPYPTDNEAGCQFGAAGGASCTNPSNPSDKYDWGVTSGGVFHPYREGGGYEYRNCTDYVAWKLESLNVPSSSVNGLGNGGQWYDNSPVSRRSLTPKAGDAAVVPSVNGSFGHVAFVESVNTIDPNNPGNDNITVSEYNHDTQGHGDVWTGKASDRGFSKYVDFGLTYNGGSGSGGGGAAPNGRHSFNGDQYADLAVLAQRSDGGIDAHVFYGSSGTPLQNENVTRSLPGSSGWSWNAIKTAEGDFNGDGYTDLAMAHQLADGGADIHVLYGNPTPFQYPTTFVKNLPGSAGWNWSQMKLEAGKFNGDQYADLSILHKRPDGGIDAHVLYGSSGTPLQTEQVTRSLPGSSGWSWDAIKTAEGDFNGDGFEDIAMVHQLADGGADVHVLYGGNPPFQYANTFTRHLDYTNGWQWSKMLIEAGKYNGDPYADLAILHQRSDGGIDTHVLFGSTGTPFQNSTTLMRSLPGSQGWNWNEVKTASGDFNGDNYDDIALLPKTGDQGADIHILYGGDPPFQYPTTWTRGMPNSSGWLWALLKIEGSSD